MPRARFMSIDTAAKAGALPLALDLAGHGVVEQTPTGLSTVLVTGNYILTQRIDRVYMDASGGGTITLPAAVAAMVTSGRMALINMGDTGTFTAVIAGGGAFAGGATSVTIPPGQTLETCVGPTAGGAYKWAKI